jgi:hypothetical protein
MLNKSDICLIWQNWVRKKIQGNPYNYVETIHGNLSILYLRNKSWKPECVLSFNMDWRILVFYLSQRRGIKFTNIYWYTGNSKMTSFFRFVDKRAFNRWYNLIRTCAGECDWFFRRKCTCWWINRYINISINTWYKCTCTMLHLFDDLWLDKIIPKNNDEGRAIYGNLENKINTLYWPYNISLFRTASRSNYAIIDYTMLQSASVVIFRNGIFHWPVKRINLIL